MSWHYCIIVKKLAIFLFIYIFTCCSAMHSLGKFSIELFFNVSKTSVNLRVNHHSRRKLGNIPSHP